MWVGSGAIHACAGDLGKLPDFSVPQFCQKAEKQRAPLRVGRRRSVSVTLNVDHLTRSAATIPSDYCDSDQVDLFSLARPDLTPLKAS